MRAFLFLFIFISLRLFSNDTNANFDSIYNKADKYLRDSYTDKGIPQIFSLINNETYSKEQRTKAKILLSEAYRISKDFKKSEDILDYIISQKDISDSNKAYAYNRLAAITSENKKKYVLRFEKVVEYSQKSIVFSRRVNWDALIYLSYNEMGFAYHRLNRPVKAMKYYKLALSGFKSKGDTLNYVNISINMASAARNLSNYKEALERLENASSYCFCEKHPNMKMRLFLEYGEVYRRMGDNKKAFEYLSEARVLQKNNFRNRMDREIEELSAKYNIKIKENKIKQIEEESHFRKQLNMVLIAVIVLFIILLVLFIRSIKLKAKVNLQKSELLNKENEKLLLKIEHKNRELVSSALTTAQQSEFSRKIAKDIKEVYPDVNDKTKRKLMNIIKELNSKRHKSLWEEFDIRFKQLHKDFYRNLVENYPNLSPAEIKICAFIRLNMSSKDIALLTNRSIRTIENTRLSIRKKTEIANDMSLVNFLINL